MPGHEGGTHNKKQQTILKQSEPINVYGNPRGLFEPGFCSKSFFKNGGGCFCMSLRLFCCGAARCCATWVTRRLLTTKDIMFWLTNYILLVSRKKNDCAQP